jgi:hypothetical protein
MDKVAFVGNISTFLCLSYNLLDTQVYYFTVMFLGLSLAKGRIRRTQHGGSSRWRSFSQQRTISIMTTSSERVGLVASIGASSGMDHRCSLSPEKRIHKNLTFCYGHTLFVLSFFSCCSFSFSSAVSGSSSIWNFQCLKFPKLSCDNSSEYIAIQPRY